MKSEIRHSISLTLVLCALGTGPAAADKKPCNQKAAMDAESATDGLKTWNSVYRFYEQFSHCDDGGIAEGVSDSVAKLFANRWDSFSEFVKLASNDKGFENFVVRHLDETIDWAGDAPKIRENARLHCPADSGRLCKILITKAARQSR